MRPTDLACSGCDASHDPRVLQGVCSRCGRPLLVRYDLRRIRGSFRPNRMGGRRADLWRYLEVLPFERFGEALALGEGWTPLQSARRLGESIGLERLFVKDESANPTGSFKARGMAVAVAAARARGALRLAVPSAGNAGVALAAYAAAAGLSALVAMPEDVPGPFVSSCRALGAEVLLVPGTIGDAGKAMREAGRDRGAFDLSTLREPYRVEGKKTMAYELFEQMGALPDAIVYPCGGGTGIVGMWKAFEEMEALGWVESGRSRLYAAQASGCAPIVRAFEAGRGEAEPFSEPKTAAAGLRVPAPLGDRLILRALRESGGGAVAVSEEEIRAGARRFARATGLLPGPETGAAVAALDRLAREGTLRPDERVVLFHTGGGLAYPDFVGALSA